jgi:Dirigent-like protein
MKRAWTLGVTVAVLMVALSAAQASAISGPERFSLLDVSRNTEEPIGGFRFDRPPVGGDQFTFVDDLYRWAGTKRGAHVGYVRGLATFVTGFGSDFSHDATVFFSAQAHLPGGTLMLEGFGQPHANGPSRFVFPVVGGTGIYANARGTVTVRDLGNGNQGKSNVDVRLEP